MAITAATFQSYSRVDHDTYRVEVQFTDSVAAPFKEWFRVSGDTLAEITADLRRQIAARIKSDAVKDVLAGIAVGTNIPITAPAPPAPPVPTAKEIWQAKARALATATQMAIVTGAPQALFDAIAALRLDVRTTYAAGHLDGL